MSECYGKIFHSRATFSLSCSNPVEQGKEPGTPEEGSCKTEKIEKFGLLL